MKRIDFEHGTITGNILGAALPMLVAQLLSLLYNIVDRIYIARIPDVGTTALGAVGLCFPIITIILAFSNLFGSGGAPLFSIERGRKDTKESSMIMNTSFFLICVCALLLMAVGMIFAKPILLLFGSSENGLIYAYPYLMIYLLGTFPSMVSTGMNPFINAQGYATTGMFSVAIGAIDPGSGFYLCVRTRYPRCGDRYGVITDSFCSVCPVFSAEKDRIESPSSVRRRNPLLRKAGKKYYQPRNRRFYHAAYQQSGDDLLQQCTFGHRRRSVYLRDDDRIEYPTDHRYTDPCHYRRFLSGHQL